MPYYIGDLKRDPNFDNYPGVGIRAHLLEQHSCKVTTCISTSTRIAKNHIPIQKTISQKPYPVASKSKKPCSKIRSSKNRVRKTLPRNPKPEKPCQKIRSQKNRAQKSEARAGKSKNPPTKNHTLFGSGFFCPDFLGTVLRIRFFGSWLSGQGFLDTVSSALVFGIRFFGHGCLGGKMWFLHHKIPIRSPRQPYPKNRIRKPEPKKTVSKKPCPESQDPKNRIRKTVPRKSGQKKPDPKRVVFGDGF